MRLIHVVLLGCGLAACGTDSESDTPDDPVARATWYQDVAPILANRCMTCHEAGGIAPFALTEYEAAVENSARMIHEIDRGAMPPFDAREEADCTPRFGWVDDPRLTTLEKDKLRMWIEDGHALGTEAQIPEVPDTTLANISKTVAPSTPDYERHARSIHLLIRSADDEVERPPVCKHGPIPHRPSRRHHRADADESELPGDHRPAADRQAVDCSEEQQPGDFTVHVWTPGNQPMQTDGDRRADRRDSS
jgi:hypothetical protein